MLVGVVEERFIVFVVGWVNAPVEAAGLTQPGVMLFPENAFVVVIVAHLYGCFIIVTPVLFS